MLEELEARLYAVKQTIHGCESLTVATTDGFVLASTHDGPQGELLAAVTSVILQNVASFMDRFKAGSCRSLDFRGNRQVLITRLEDLDAYLICVLHPGAKAVDVSEPALRAMGQDLPEVLHGHDCAPSRAQYLLQVERCLIPVRTGFLIGKAPHCDLLVAGPRVEKEHLRFEVLGSKCLVRDLDTKHGTRVNRRSFSGTIEVQPGDRISLPRAGGFNVLAINARGKLVGVKKKKKKKKK
ncbi:MAG: FHA domain-containing protein, partial [Planctomycetota bacterium]